VNKSSKKRAKLAAFKIALQFRVVSWISPLRLSLVLAHLVRYLGVFNL